MKETERKQLILGNYFTLEMCRKKLNKYAHLYLNNIQVAERYNKIKKDIELSKQEEAEQSKKIANHKSRINFMNNVLKSGCQTLCVQPVTKKDLETAMSELSAMNDTLNAIHEKLSIQRNTILALLNFQSEEQIIEETLNAKESYFKILNNYNKLLHEINILAGTSHAQRPNLIQELNPICLEELLGEDCELEHN